MLASDHTTPQPDSLRSKDNGRPSSEWDNYFNFTSTINIDRASSPILSATDGSIACNKPGTVTNPQLTAPVTAGSQITAYWNSWPHDLGPVLVHLANCNGECTNANPSSLNWFKIHSTGSRSMMAVLSVALCVTDTGPRRK